MNTRSLRHFVILCCLRFKITYWSPSSRVKADCLTFEILVRNYHSKLYKIPRERKSYFHNGLKMLNLLQDIKWNTVLSSVKQLHNWTTILVIVKYLCKVKEMNDFMSCILSSLEQCSMICLVRKCILFQLFYLSVIHEIPHFPAYETHFFSRKMWPKSTCVLCAEGKYYFQTYNTRTSIVPHLNRCMILVALTMVFWVSVMNKYKYTMVDNFGM
jgi:hypothetical protein